MLYQFIPFIQLKHLFFLFNGSESLLVC